MSSADDPRTNDAAVAAWMATADELLWGFNHALSNRLAAINSIARILEYSDTGLDGLLSALSEEIGSLERTLDLLRLVPKSADTLPEPVRLQDLLPELVRLHRFRGDVRDLAFDLRIEAETAPVLVDPALLGHAILLVLGAVSRAALAVGGHVVRVRTETAGEVVVTIVEGSGGGEAAEQIEVPDAAPGGEAGGPLTRAELEMVQRLIGATGGVVLGSGRQGGLDSVELRLPTLMAARLRERGAS